MAAVHEPALSVPDVKVPHTKIELQALKFDFLSSALTEAEWPSAKGRSTALMNCT